MMIKHFHNDDVGKLILRLTLGVLMLFHGVAKIMHTASVDFIGSKLAETGLPSFFAYGVYVGEVIAPLLIIIGMYSRYAAAVVVVNMLVAILLMHTGDIMAMTDHGGWRLELQGFYLFCAIAIMYLGSGKFALKQD